MIQLELAPSERLCYRSTTDELEMLFKEISSPIPPLPDGFNDMPAEKRLQALEAHKKILHESIAFLKAHVVPKESEAGMSIIRIAYDKEDNIVGRIAIHDADGIHPSLDIKVLPERRQNGYGYEMLRAMIGAAFRQLDFDHLEYDVFIYNTASRHLVQKLGGKLVLQEYCGECYRIDRPVELEYGAD